MRALLSEARRRHHRSSRYSDNLEEMQDWLGPLKRQLMVREHELGHHSEVASRLLDWLPDVLALFETLAASIEHADVAQIAQKHLASKRLMEENSRYESIAAQLEVAVSNNRDDLAAAGIAEQMDIEARIPILEANIADCAAQEKELESFIQALQAKKRDMRAELAAFQQTRKDSTPGSSAMAQGKSTEQRVEKASGAFERVLENATGVPGRAGDMGNARKLAELDELSRQNRIAERLAALKADQG